MNIIFAIFCLLLFALVIFWLWRRSTATVESLCVDYNELGNEAFTIIGAKDLPEDSWDNITDWLQLRKTKAIILVHGTFAGTDPMGLIKLFSQYSLDADERDSRAAKWSKLISDKILGDVGNFTEDYRCELEGKLEQKIPVTLFNWSSENHHFARLTAAGALLTRLNNLSDQLGILPGERIMLVGHSHAAQVFALLSHLMRASSIQIRLLAAFHRGNAKSPTIPKQNSAFANGIFDFVTLGAPPRYTWSKNLPGKILHIINHRRNSERAGSFKGIWQTKDGDYVQQIGIAGSDFSPAGSKAKAANRHLDGLLGPGSDRAFLRRALKVKRRLVSNGHNLLVDFGDKSRLTPNAQKTMFGHGCYTRSSNMKLVFSLIKQYF